jgi:hypothetical protein
MDVFMLESLLPNLNSEQCKKKELITSLSELNSLLEYPLDDPNPI